MLLFFENSKIFNNRFIIEFFLVRSYRYLESAERLIPLNKWEMPTHIIGFSIGIGRYKKTFLSDNSWKLFF